MAGPTQLNPTEQDSLVKQIGLALLRAAPADWASVEVAFRAIGRYTEVRGQVSFTDERTAEVPIAPEVVGLFARLRAGMYREGRGTWFNARYQLDRPAAYNLEYDRDEPRWQNPPPPPAFVDELRMFPRDDENVPEWLARRLSAMQPPFRTARIFDGVGPSGPVVNRPPLEDEEREQVQRYLDAAPLALPARGYDVDHLDEERRQTVPVAFHTDGTWIWPAAVNFYLRTHGVTPDPDLVAHARRAEFRVGEVDEQVRAAAAAFIAGPRRPSGPPPRPPQDAPDFAHPERVPAEEPNAPTFATPERVPEGEPSPGDRPFTPDDPAGMSPHPTVDHARPHGERPEAAPRRAEQPGPESDQSHEHSARSEVGDARREGEQPDAESAHPDAGFTPTGGDHAQRRAEAGFHFARPETDHAGQEAEQPGTGFGVAGNDTHEAAERPDADQRQAELSSGPAFAQPHDDVTRPEADHARRGTGQPENGFAHPDAGVNRPGGDAAEQPDTGFAQPGGDRSSEQPDTEFAHSVAGFNPLGDDAHRAAEQPESSSARPVADFGDPQGDDTHEAPERSGTAFDPFAPRGDDAQASERPGVAFSPFTRPDNDFGTSQSDDAQATEQHETAFAPFTRPDTEFGDSKGDSDQPTEQPESAFTPFTRPDTPQSDDAQATEQHESAFTPFTRPDTEFGTARGDDTEAPEQPGTGFAPFTRPDNDFGTPQGDDTQATEQHETAFAPFTRPDTEFGDSKGDSDQQESEQSVAGFAETDTVFGEPRGERARQEADRFEADHLATERPGTDFARSQDRDAERSETGFGLPGADVAEPGTDHARREDERSPEADHPESDFAGPDAAHADGVVQPTMEYSDPDLGSNHPEVGSTEDEARSELQERGTGRRAMAGLFDQPEYAEPFDAFGAGAGAPVSKHAIPDEPNVPDPVIVDAPLPPADIVSRLRRRLGEVGVPEDRYTVGTPTGPGWTMEQTGGGWRVGWFDGHYVAPAVFADAADAAAFLAGKVLLAEQAPPARDPGPPTLRASLAQLEDDDDDEYDQRVRRPLPPPKRPVQSGPSGEDLFRPSRPVTDGLFEPRRQFDDEDEFDHGPGRGDQVDADAESPLTSANGSAAEHSSADSPHQDTPDAFTEHARDSFTPHTAAQEQAPEPTPHRPTFPPRPAPSTSRDDAREPQQFAPHETEGQQAPPEAPGRFAAQETPGQFATYREPAPHDPDAPGPFAHLRQAAPGQFAHQGPGHTTPNDIQGPGLFNSQTTHDTPEQSAHQGPGHTTPNDTQGPGLFNSQTTHDTPEQFAHEGSRQPGAPEPFTRQGQFTDQEPGPLAPGQQAEDASERFAHRGPGRPAPSDAQGASPLIPGQQAPHDTSGQFAHQGRRQAGPHDTEGHPADQGPGPDQQAPRNAPGHPGHDGPGPFTPALGQQAPEQFARQGRRQAGPQGHFADRGPGQQAPHNAPGQFAPQGPRQADPHDTADQGPGSPGQQAPHDAPGQFAHRGPAPNDGPGQFGSQGPGQFAPQEAGGQFVTQAPEHTRPTDRRRTPEGPQQPPRPEPRKAEAPSGLRRPQDWPIQPLSGEPPLTLFRGKQVTELPTGAEIDRYGDPTGNLTYAVGTPFDRRSLVPDWINRPYHAYRVARPTEALTGAAIPWFDQPGGGTAYILSHSVADLVESGHLVEIPDHTPPPRA